jgi:hypothetical protein
MKTLRLITSLSLSLCLFHLIGCAPTQTAATSQAQIPPVEPGMARVWFFRQADPPGGNVFAAEPMITVNDAPFSQIKQGTAFFHNFPPGRYKFKVQAFGTPTGERDSFVVQPASPEIAQQYLPTLTNLGQR